MSASFTVYRGRFGRATISHLSKPLSPHAHREGHLVFKISGADAKMKIEQDLFDISEELAVAINPWKVHQFWAEHNWAGGVYLVLYIQPDWFLEFGKDTRKGLSFGSGNIYVTDEMRYLSNLVIAHLLREQHSDAFSDYLYQLTKECYDQSWEDNVCDIRHSQAGISITDFRIRNSIRLMRDNFGEEIFLDNIARDSGLSRPHFYKLFRQNVGLTPNMYLNMLRMENAIDLLTTTTESITSIGLDMGFSSQASFTRFFTSNVGIAPTDYRRATVVCG